MRKAGLGGSSAMHVVSPKSGDVLEHGSVCVLSAEEFGAHELVSVSIADARSWSGRWWREIEKTRAGVDGVVCVRWVVPKDLPVADAYVVRFAGSGGSACSSAGTAGTDDTKQPKPSSGKQSKSSSEKTTTREAEVSNVKVTSPLKLTRVGRDLVEIQWSPSALPTEQSGREGWRLAIDVLPVLRHDEYHPDVVGDLFLRAAFDGLTVHTRLKSGTCCVSYILTLFTAPLCALLVTFTSTGNNYTRHKCTVCPYSIPIDSRLTLFLSNRSPLRRLKGRSHASTKNSQACVRPYLPNRPSGVHSW